MSVGPKGAVTGVCPSVRTLKALRLLTAWILCRRPRPLGPELALD